MTPAERQRRRRGVTAPLAVRTTFAEIAENPKVFARAFRARLGYMAALDLRDALDKAMDDWRDDDPPSGYLLGR